MSLRCRNGSQARSSWLLSQRWQRVADKSWSRNPYGLTSCSLSLVQPKPLQEVQRSALSHRTYLRGAQVQKRVSKVPFLRKWVGKLGLWRGKRGWKRCDGRCLSEERVLRYGQGKLSENTPLWTSLSRLLRRSTMLTVLERRVCCQGKKRGRIERKFGRKSEPFTGGDWWGPILYDLLGERAWLWTLRTSRLQSCVPPELHKTNNCDQVGVA